MRPVRALALVAVPLFALSACRSAHSVEDDARWSVALGSEPRAVEIAARIVEAAGGREAWEDVRAVEWTVSSPGFPRRYVWDKRTDDVRVEQRGVVALVNARTLDGRLFEAGVEVGDEPRRAPMLAQVVSTWRDDSM